MTRRALLAASLAYLFCSQWRGQIASVFPLIKDAPKKKFLVEFVTLFARPMRKDQYEAHKGRYMNRHEVDRILNDFLEEKKIFNSKSHFAGESNHWFVLFDGESSYLEWCDVVNKNRVYREEYRHLVGFSRINRGLSVTDTFDFDSVNGDAMLALTKMGKDLWRSHV